MRLLDRRLRADGHRVLGYRLRQEGVPGRIHQGHQDAAVGQEDLQEVLRPTLNDATYSHNMIRSDSKKNMQFLPLSNAIKLVVNTPYIPYVLVHSRIILK